MYLRRALFRYMIYIRPISYDDAIEALANNNRKIPITHYRK